MYNIFHGIWHQWHAIIIFGSICLSTVVIGYIFSWVIKKILSIWKQEKNESNVILGKKWLKILFIAPVLLLAYCVETVFLIPKEYVGYYYHLLNLIVIIFATWLIVQSLYALRDHILKRALKDKNKDSGRDINFRALYTKLNILLKIAVFVIIALGVSIALMTFPTIHQIGVSILASAGVASVVVGFAAQKNLSNLLTGIHIALTQPIKIDDIVKIEGETGAIEEITLSYVVVRIWDKRRLIIPTTYFTEKVFQNWTHTSFDLNGTVILPVDYATPVDELRTALDNILQLTDLWDGKTKELSVTEAKPQSMEVRIVVSAKDSTTLFDLRCYVREKLIEFMQKKHPHCLPKIKLEMEG